MLASGIRIVALAAVLSMLAGCAANRTAWAPEIVKDVYCTIDKNGDGVISDDEKGLYVPVELSRDDTDRTIEQVIVNSTVHDQTCGVTPPSN